MTRLISDISMSLDGFVAGPKPSLEQPLGERGERLHEWAFGLKSWREPHGLPGGERGPDDEVVAESLRATGAVVMGRRMFSGGEGPWEDDPNADGWWGDDPPFHKPVYVVTHHEREPLVKEDTTFTFVTDGVERAIEQARAAAGEKVVGIGGGAKVIQQALELGLLDELRIHLVPILLGGGVRLFENVSPLDLERTGLADSPTGVIHLRFRRRE